MSTPVSSGFASPNPASSGASWGATDEFVSSAVTLMGQEEGALSSFTAASIDFQIGNLFSELVNIALNAAIQDMKDGFKDEGEASHKT